MSGGPDEEVADEEEEEIDKVKNDSDEIEQKRRQALRARMRNLAVQLCFAACLFIAVWAPYYNRNGQDWQAVDAIHQFVKNPISAALDGSNVTLNAQNASKSTPSGAAAAVPILPFFDDIGSIDHVWLWLQNTMLDMMFPAKLYPGGAPGKFLGVAHVINAIRFHQKRVNRATCDSLDPNLDLVVAGADCHVMWTSEAEQRSTWGPFNKFKYSLSSGVQTIYEGRLASYDMGGFYTDVLASRASAAEALADLKVVDWIDLQTRAIFVDFAVYYPSSKGFASVRLAFEFSPSGGIFTSLDVQPLLLYTFTNMPALLVIEIAVVALQGYFFLQVIQSNFCFCYSIICPIIVQLQVVLELLKLRRLFFKEGENVMDLVYNFVLTACILGRMQCQFISSSFSPASSDKGTHVSMHGIIQIQHNLRSFSAVCLWCCFFMIGCRVLLLQPEVNQRFRRVFRHSFLDILVGSGFLIIMFIASGAAIQILLGNRLENFSNLHNSVLFQLHSIFGSMTEFEESPYGKAASPRFSNREKGEVIAFLIVSLVLFFTLVVGVFVSALAVAFINIAREDRHRPGADFRKGIRDKIRRAIVVTDVHSQRLEDFNEFIEAMIDEIGLTDGVTGDIPKVDVAVINTLISEYRHVANYAGIHSAAQVMRLFDLEGKGYLTISQLRNFKRFLIQARVTVPEAPSADTDRPIRPSTTRPPQLRADEVMGSASGDTVGSTVRAIKRDFPAHNVSGGAMGSSGIGFQVTAKSSDAGDDACFSDMSIVDAVPRLQKDLYVHWKWQCQLVM